MLFWDAVCHYMTSLFHCSHAMYIASSIITQGEIFTDEHLLHKLQPRAEALNLSLILYALHMSWDCVLLCSPLPFRRAILSVNLNFQWTLFPGPPSLRSADPQKLQHGAPLAASVRFHVVAWGHPLPTFQWKRILHVNGGITLQLPSYSSGDQSSLIISDVKEDDYGYYLVTASNQYGQWEDIIFSLDAEGKVLCIIIQFSDPNVC